jgi:hypothetical protein
MNHSSCSLRNAVLMLATGAAGVVLAAAPSRPASAQVVVFDTITGAASDGLVAVPTSGGGNDFIADTFESDPSGGDLLDVQMVIGLDGTDDSGDIGEQLNVILGGQIFTVQSAAFPGSTVGASPGVYDLGNLGGGIALLAIHNT